jgi:hypothetical protein
VSGTTMLALAALILLASGLLMSWLAGRFGLERFGWGIVGAALGPLALAPFVGEVRASRRPRRRDPSGDAAPARHGVGRGPPSPVAAQRGRPR